MFWPGHIFGFLRVPILHNSSAEVLDLSKKADLQKSTVRSQLGWIRINIWRNGSMERDKSKKKKNSWISWIGWIHLLMTIEHNLRYRWRFCNYPHMVPGWVLDCIHIYIYIARHLQYQKSELFGWLSSPPQFMFVFCWGLLPPVLSRRSGGASWKLTWSSATTSSCEPWPTSSAAPTWHIWCVQIRSLCPKGEWNEWRSFTSGEKKGITWGNATENGKWMAEMMRNHQIGYSM